MEIERIDYRDAAKIMARDAHIDLSKYERKVGSQGTTAPEENREDLKALNKTAEARFSSSLIASAGEIYLREQRKLSDKTIQTFGLGYAPEGYYDLVSAMQAKGYTGEKLVSASLARQGQQGEYSSFFRKRIMFPIWDHIGNVVGFAGRALSPDDMPKYLNISETPLYEKSKILYGMHIAKAHVKEFGCMIIVEGYMDVIALFDAGLPIGVASCGTALTPQQVKLLKRNTEHIIFSFDSDTAGFEATIRGLKVAFDGELYPSVLTLPTGYKDIDEYVHSNEPYQTYLLDPNSRQDGFSFLIIKLLEKYDSKNPVERKKIQTICFDVLASLQDYSILMMYIEQLAFKLSTNQQSLFQQFKVYLKQKPSIKSTVVDVSTTQKELDNNPYTLFTAFYDPVFCQEFFASVPIYIGLVEQLIKDIHIYMPDIVQITGDPEQISASTLRWSHHYGGLDENKRTAEILARIKVKLLPSLEKSVIKQNISTTEKQSLLSNIGTIKRL